jgi:hypothetical protein
MILEQIGKELIITSKHSLIDLGDPGRLTIKDPMFSLMYLIPAV